MHAELPEPVRRYLAHALPEGGPGPERMRLTMAGRIRVGAWLAFTAVQEFDGHAFTWSARAGRGPVKPLHVVDRYRDGAGSTEGRLLGRMRFMHADDPDTARAAAGRAAAESIWMPGVLARAAVWRAEGEDVIVARLDVPPEQPDVRLRIDAAGAVRSVSLMRWGNVGRPGFGPIPFGGDVHAERRFGDVVLPSRVSVGWWYGTPRHRPFFEATILEAEAG